MKAKKYPQLSVNLLLITVISALFVIFVFMLKQRPTIPLSNISPVSNVTPITSVKEFDSMLDDLNKADSTSLINSELNKLSTDATGI